jgi:hypothetical protein
VGQNAPPPPQASRSAPCTQAEYREFDFWVGSWDVEVKGKVVGHNDVTLEQDGCLIVENWRSLISRETGSSFNYYDKQDQKWHQLYIPNNGIARSYPPLAGRLKGGAMVLVNSDDPRKIDRWIWTPLAGGKVRQRAEQSKDGGNTWTTTWDSVYFRRMSQRATGSFEVKLSPQAPAAETEDANIGRMIIDKRFHGELEAASKGEMLSAMSGVKGSAGYVALERVTGTLAGKTGSFVLQHSGSMDRGKPSLTVSVVPDSGTEDLTGLSGTMQIIVEGAKHSYVFEYSLPAR